MNQVPNKDISVPDDRDLALRFTEYAKAARGTAMKNRTKGDFFGEELASCRAEVYERAAELARRLPPAEAANQMMDQAKATHVRTPPLIGFDQAGKQYTTARAWQFCAWQIDPTLPEVAPKWS